MKINTLKIFEPASSQLACANCSLNSHDY